MKKSFFRILPAVILFVAAVVVLGGCVKKYHITVSRSSTATPSEGGYENKKYPLTVDLILIGKGAMYGNGAENLEPQNIVIRNAAEWQNLLSAMNSYNNISESFAETDIDFEKFQLIVIIDSIRPSLSEINITKIIENKSDLSVYVEKIPYEATVITQPFCIVKIGKTNKNITFINS